MLAVFNTDTYVPFSAGVAQLVVNYAASCVVFGPQDWHEYYGFDVQEEQLSEEAFRWWLSLDAVTPFDLEGNPIFNYETHHGFYYLPANGPGGVSLDLKKFDRLAQKPKKGLASRFKFTTLALRQNRNIKAVTSCWAAVRKEILFRNESAEDQRALMAKLNTEKENKRGALSVRLKTLYEVFPSLRDLSIIARVHFSKTGERLLGDSTGVEGRTTYSRTEQQVVTLMKCASQVIVGGQSPSVSEGPVPSGGLDVNYGEHDFAQENVGVAGLSKFRGS